MTTQPDRSAPLRRVDWVTILLYLLLVAVGWFSIYGATYDFGQTDPFSWSSHTGKQLVWIGSAFALAFVLLMLDERLYESLTLPFYAAMMCLLLVTIFIATDIKGSRSWLSIGSSVRLQPAEFAKAATALMLAKYMSIYGFSLRNSRQACIVVGLILLPIAFIIGQREAGSALVYLAFMFMLYREGMPGSVIYCGFCAIIYFLVTIRYGAEHLFDDTTPLGFSLSLLFALISTMVMCHLQHSKTRARKLASSLIKMHYVLPVLLVGLLVCFFFPFNFSYLLAALLVGLGLYLVYRWAVEHLLHYLLIGLFALGSAGFIYSSDYIFSNILEAHQQVRIKMLLGMEDDPAGAGYNVRQSLIAIGSGGLSGKGFLNGTQTKLKYVPEQQTDFIFCTIGEEEGFIGASLVLLLYVLLILRVMSLSERGTSFTRIYGYCVASILSFHLIINVGMVLGLTPVIGIPLPFLSYGGSSLWGFTILLFILLRLDAARKR